MRTTSLLALVACLQCHVIGTRAGKPARFCPPLRFAILNRRNGCRRLTERRDLSRGSGTMFGIAIAKFISLYRFGDAECQDFKLSLEVICFVPFFQSIHLTGINLEILDDVK